MITINDNFILEIFQRERVVLITWLAVTVGLFNQIFRENLQGGKVKLLDFPN